MSSLRFSFCVVLVRYFNIYLRPKDSNKKPVSRFCLKYRSHEFMKFSALSYFLFRFIHTFFFF